MSRCASCGGTLQVGVDGDALCAVCLLQLAAQQSAASSQISQSDLLGLAPDEPEPLRYRTLSVLGGTACATTYLAEGMPPLPRYVAVKVLNVPVDAASANALRSLARRIAQLRHPVIVTLREAGVTPGGAPYFAREYVRGLAIDRHCEQFRLTLRQRVTLAGAIIPALQDAHDLSIVHGGVKSSNVLVVGDGDKAAPRLLDLGVLHATSRLPSAVGGAALVESRDVQDVARLIGAIAEPAEKGPVERSQWPELSRGLGRFGDPEYASRAGLNGLSHLLADLATLND